MSFRMTLSDLAKYWMTLTSRSVARFLCDSWASCLPTRLVSAVGLLLVDACRLSLYGSRAAKCWVLTFSHIASYTYFRLAWRPTIAEFNFIQANVAFTNMRCIGWYDACTPASAAHLFGVDVYHVQQYDVYIDLRLGLRHAHLYHELVVFINICSCIIYSVALQTRPTIILAPPTKLFSTWPSVRLLHTVMWTRMNRFCKLAGTVVHRTPKYGPLMAYSTLSIGVTLKSVLGVVQGHLKMPPIDRSCTTLYWSAVVSIALPWTIFGHVAKMSPNIQLTKHCDYRSRHHSVDDLTVIGSAALVAPATAGSTNSARTISAHLLTYGEQPSSVVTLKRRYGPRRLRDDDDDDRTKCNFSTTVWDFYTQISRFTWERSCYNSLFL